MSERSRILIAERDGPTRAGLRLALGSADFDVVAEATDCVTAVEAARGYRPDIALVGVDLPGGAIDAVRAISDGLPGTKVIVLSPDPDGQELVAAVLAGAAGYLSKEIGAERLPFAIHGVLRGEVALPRRYTNHLLDELRARDTERTLVEARTSALLTDRQWEILRLLGENASTAEMANRLGISEVTVRRHVSSVLEKLGVADRASAAQVVRRSAR